MTHYKTYPFTAIIGQELMKQALILNAINPRIGGVLIKGAKGTAKSTAVRALADLLPKIPIMKSCEFNCNPYDVKEACHACQELIKSHQITPEQIEMQKMRVINLPINATEDRIIGTINIETALTQGLKALEPGILAESNRNILYIDEVNLLADNVADILLDAAAMGINIIEREGISLHHPAKFILIGTMNPEEGHLRPQLLDRFGLSVEVEKIHDIDKRVQIITNLEEYHHDPTEFHDKAEPNQEKLRQKIIKAREILPKVQISHKLLSKIAQIGIIFDTDGHRADITMNITAKTIAAFHGRTEVTLKDIQLAAKLALPHRMRRLPFEDDTLDQKKLEKVLHDDHPERKEPKRDKEKKEEKNEREEGDANTGQNSADHPQNEENLQSSDPNSNQNSHSSQIEHFTEEQRNKRTEIFTIDEKINTAQLLDKKRIRKIMNTTGNMISHPTKSVRGKYLGHKKESTMNLPLSSDIAIVPTLNSASLNPENHNSIQNDTPLTIKRENIILKSRQGKSSYLIIFCLDTSGSMGTKNRMEMAKGAIFSILQKNYINRDKVCLVTFHENDAQVILPPTRSIDLAHKFLQNIPTGGTTPLTAGLLKSLYIAEEELNKNTGYIPLILLISDARGNISITNEDEELLKVSQAILKKEISMIVVDTEQSNIKMGCAEEIAQFTHAAYYHIDKLSTTQMEQILQQEGLKYVEV
jgi:magnesium chelatase subunit D